jgi:hypothetical protein
MGTNLILDETYETKTLLFTHESRPSTSLD